MHEHIARHPLSKYKHLLNADDPSVTLDLWAFGVVVSSNVNVAISIEPASETNTVFSNNNEILKLEV